MSHSKHDTPQSTPFLDLSLTTLTMAHGLQPRLLQNFSWFSSHLIACPERQGQKNPKGSAPHSTEECVTGLVYTHPVIFCNKTATLAAASSCILIGPLLAFASQDVGYNKSDLDAVQNLCFGLDTGETCATFTEDWDKRVYIQVSAPQEKLELAAENLRESSQQLEKSMLTLGTPVAPPPSFVLDETQKRYATRVTIKSGDIICL